MIDYKQLKKGRKQFHFSNQKLIEFFHKNLIVSGTDKSKLYWTHPLCTFVIFMNIGQSYLSIHGL